MTFNAIRENKILAKISEFRVYSSQIANGKGVDPQSSFKDVHVQPLEMLPPHQLPPPPPKKKKKKKKKRKKEKKISMFSSNI